MKRVKMIEVCGLAIAIILPLFCSPFMSLAQILLVWLGHHHRDENAWRRTLNANYEIELLWWWSL